MRAMIMGENYERNITLIRSDISRFSRGTISDRKKRRSSVVLELLSRYKHGSAVHVLMRGKCSCRVVVCERR